MRAVKNNLPTPSGEVWELEGPRWTRAVGIIPPTPSTLVGTSSQSLGPAYLVDAHVQLRMKSHGIQQQYYPVSVRHFPHEYGFKPRKWTTIDLHDLSLHQACRHQRHIAIVQPFLDGVDHGCVQLNWPRAKLHDFTYPCGITHSPAVLVWVKSCEEISREKGFNDLLARPADDFVFLQQRQETLNAILFDVQFGLFFLVRLCTDCIPWHFDYSS